MPMLVSRSVEQVSLPVCEGETIWTYRRVERESFDE